MDIREEFLKFFEESGHQRYESMPLVPDDPTLLFTNAGMVAFKDIFTGNIPAPKNRRATSCQMCMRAGGKHNDLENVGYTSRHHTLFEMLGNFSFGDYFKEEAIDYGWSFVTETLGLDKKDLYVTVHNDDDEAFKIWTKHVPASKIKRMGDKDNFWQMGDTGPCGPCSEIFVDQGEKYFNGPEDYFGGDGDRFLEIWNLVFMQFERSKDGVLKPLPKPSIDTGMGLERATAVKEGKHSNFDSSIFMPLINNIQELVGKKYIYSEGASFRVIADHIRAVSFLLAQGVNFDKEGRGYVLRRIARRAVRHGYMLGKEEPFIYKLVDVLAGEMGGHYGYLRDKKEQIKEQIKNEEERFFQTIASGMELFKKELENTTKIFSGEAAFKLYDTFGFPLDLTADMLREKGMGVDMESFERCMEHQKQMARSSWKGNEKLMSGNDFSGIISKYGKNQFVGYKEKRATSKVLALLNDEYKEVDSLKAGEKGHMLLEKSPFYAESGGQCGDIGELLHSDAIVAKVTDTKKLFDLNVLEVEVCGDIRQGEDYLAIVDDSRQEIAKHHSATHLLHASLRNILGESVAQAGSLVERDRLRFDFSFGRALSADEILVVQDSVNAMVARGIANNTQECDIQSAKNMGAMALFGEKYGEHVRVVAFGDASIELCGGCHVDNSAEVGTFIITKESGVSAGVRRIEALCGNAAYEYAKNLINTINTIKEEVKSLDPILGIKKLKEQNSELKKELKEAQNSVKSELVFEEQNGVKWCVAQMDTGDIKAIIDVEKEKHDNVALMLIAAKDEKVSIACGQKGTKIDCGKWIKAIAPILGGGGGGRADFAQAGGKDVSKIEEALQASRDYLQNNL